MYVHQWANTNTTIPLPPRISTLVKNLLFMTLLGKIPPYVQRPGRGVVGLSLTHQNLKERFEFD